MRTCVCKRCGIPLSKEITEAVYFKVRATCTTPDEHKICDIGALKILAPSLNVTEEISLLKSICVRRMLEGGELNAALAGLFVEVARLELSRGLQLKSKATCDAVKLIFADLPPAQFKRLTDKMRRLHNPL